MLKRLYLQHRYFFYKNYVWTFGSFAVGALTTLLSASILSRVLTPEHYGTYKYVLAIASLLTGFSLTGFTTSISIDVARKKFELVKPQVKLFLYSGIPAMLVSIVFAYVQFQRGAYSLGISIVFCTLFLLLSSAFGLYAVVLQNQEKHRKNFYLWAVGMIVNTLLCILAGVYFKSGTVLVLTYAITLVSFNGIVFYQVVKHFPPAAKNNVRISPTVWHNSFNSLFLQLAFNLDKILLYSYMGAANVAIYNFAIAIPDQLRGIFKNISRSFFPNLVTKDPKSIRGHIIRYTLQLLVVAIVFAAVYAVLAPIIFRILFPTYLNAVWLSRLFALSVLSGAGLYAYTLIEAKEHNKHMHLVTIGGSLFQILLYFLYIPTRGLEGAIIATIIGRLWYLFAPIVIVLRVYRNPTAPQQSLE